MKFKQVAEHLLSGKSIFYAGYTVRLKDGNLWNENTQQEVKSIILSECKLSIFESMAEFVTWVSAGKPFVKDQVTYKLVEGVIVGNTTGLTHNWDTLNYREFYKG